MLLMMSYQTTLFYHRCPIGRVCLVSKSNLFNFKVLIAFVFTFLVTERPGPRGHGEQRQVPAARGARPTSELRRAEHYKSLMTTSDGNPLIGRREAVRHVRVRKDERTEDSVQGRYQMSRITRKRTSRRR